MASVYAPEAAYYVLHSMSNVCVPNTTHNLCMPHIPAIAFTIAIDGILDCILTFGLNL